MIMQAQEKKIYTPEEYLDLEVDADTRHEYINGEIIPMTGGTPNHNEIAGNFYILLKSKLKGKAYRIFYIDQRLWIPDFGIYTYLDVMVVAKPIELQAGRNDTIVNPVLIAEVLSKSTKNYDRDEKFSAYRSIPSFQEYLLIDQYTAHVEQYSKTDENKWIFSEYNAMEIELQLESIACTFTLENLYSDIEFESV
ncbi:MAG: Uma2 family endonuclease [Coleofasciculaceae cyanobacterium SM2_1_6]|nr:Uma2 family endonuclease [Coleofasciculaceae cyanobacterium SM2_1_6]